MDRKYERDNRPKKKCYIYTRVSTAIQVEGYSLDAQREKLMNYANFEDMVVVGEYSDEGKSGKNVEGRPQFRQMIDDIENRKDDVDFVLVFKLSRFGRNAADVYYYLQKIQDYGTNLICVEDNIDSSKDSGKLMMAVLAAVAEIERDNILVQTMEGRRRKAREGKWNGGFAPYGYSLKEGKLEIEEDEAEAVRVIFDKYIHTTMGINAIADFLNENGYKKKIRQNNTLNTFAESFIKGVIDNPVYCGKISYGRRKNEKIEGTRNKYHIVKQNDYMVVQGIHKPIISEEDWELAHQKRLITGVKQTKKHSLDHEHILSGIIKCPCCGTGMYANVNRKKKPDGTYYKDHFYYACKRRHYVDGVRCGYKHQWTQEIINSAVEELISKLVNKPNFQNAMKEKVGSSIDTESIEKELQNLIKARKKKENAIDRLGTEIDNLDPDDGQYSRKYDDKLIRLDKLYSDLSDMEEKIHNTKTRLDNIQQKRLSEDSIYQILKYFDKLYAKFTDLQKKEFMKSFVSEIQIFEEPRPDGRIIKDIKFKFPVYFEGGLIDEISWDNETTVETVCLLGRVREIEP